MVVNMSLFLPFSVKKRHDLNGRKVEVKKAVPKEHMDGN